MQDHTLAEQLEGRERALFRSWVQTQQRLVEAERALFVARAAENGAWEHYTRTLKPSQGLSWSDRFADALRAYWSTDRG